MDRLYDNRGASHDGIPSCNGSGPTYYGEPQRFDREKFKEEIKEEDTDKE